MKRKGFMAVLLILVLVFTVAGCSAKPGNTAGPQTGQKSAGQTTENKEVSIIAKSGSKVSSDEKEAVLDDISKELDDIINNAGSWEDVEDSDLE